MKTNNKCVKNYINEDMTKIDTVSVVNKMI